MKPWEEGYELGLQDGAFGKKPEIEKISSGPFSSIFEMEVKQARDKGYLAGYKDGKKEYEQLIGSENIQENFKNGFLNGFQDASLKIKKAVSKTDGSFPEPEEAYRRGYILGYKIGSR